MRQIDADALKTDVRRYVLDGTDEFGDIPVGVAERSFLGLIDRQPTIKAEPVRKMKAENKALKEEVKKLRLEMSYMHNPNTIGDRHEMGCW